MAESLSKLAEINNEVLSRIEESTEKTSNSVESLVSKISDQMETDEKSRLKGLADKKGGKSSAGSLFTPANNNRSGLLGGLLDGIGIPEIGTMLGGFTAFFAAKNIGSLFGRALGRLFLPAVGAFFSVKYLDKWIDPLVDKITGDDATWNMFGQQIDASKIVAGFGGAFAVIFGKDALMLAVKTALSKDAAGNATLRAKFLKRIGIGGIVLALADGAGSWLADYTGSQEFGDGISTAMSLAGIGYMILGPKGALIGGLIGMAYTGLRLTVSWLDSQRSKLENSMAAEFEKTSKEFDAAVARNDLPAAEAAARKAEANARRQQQIQSKRAAEAAATRAAQQSNLANLDPSLQNQMRKADSLVNAASMADPEKRSEMYKSAVEIYVNNGMSLEDAVSTVSSKAPSVQNQQIIWGQYGQGFFDDLRPAPTPEGPTRIEVERKARLVGNEKTNSPFGAGNIFTNDPNARTRGKIGGVVSTKADTIANSISDNAGLVEAIAGVAQASAAPTIQQTNNNVSTSNSYLLDTAKTVDLLDGGLALGAR